MNFKMSIHNSCQRMLAFFVTATVAALFMMVSMVQAAEWYVRAGVPSSGDGTTLATAFKTINEGISAASAGDVVNVREGTYNERLVIDKQLRLDGYGVFTNVVPLDVPTADVYDVEVNASGTRIIGFTFFFNGTDGTRSGNGIIVGDLNGPPVTDVYIGSNTIYPGHTNTGIRTGKYADVSGLIINRNTIRGDPGSMCEGIYIHPYTGVGNVTIQNNY
jgi:nitrous oxidase accessory protein NosD